MTENQWGIVWVAAIAVALVALGWLARTWWSNRRLDRKQRFFGLPDNAECLMVVSRDQSTAHSTEWAVSRVDTVALLELSALVRSCGAHTELVTDDAAQQGFGDRTEICVGGPLSHRRIAAHLRSLLPGVSYRGELGAGGEHDAFVVGEETYQLENGLNEYVLLARLTAGREEGARPVFLACGQRPITHQAAARYLSRHHVRLARKYGAHGTFVLMLKVVNSQAYGADLVELVGDVTKAACTPLAALERR
ncbi:hypothetical protein [Streptomyces sp. NPDC005438]|uniref:hypothetical protein n=1 Tax=Streptomyces sp. NPDC005438 TaxID=3156880 RepID=UPI0033AB2D0F